MSKISSVAQTILRKAIELAPDQWMPGGTPDPLIGQEGPHVGASIPRIDGPLKVTGGARFAAEFPIEGMAYAALAFSTTPKGRIIALDTAAAEAAPGVVLVMTYRNAPRMKAPPAFLAASKGAAGDDLPVMQDDLVHWNGQPIALVLAETQEEADHAETLIRVQYAEEPATTAYDAAKAEGSEVADYQGQPLRNARGDAEARLAQAPFSIDATYSTPRLNHNAIEPHAVTVAWDGEALALHDASQCVDHVAFSLAQALGLDEAKVHVTSPFVGGGFGGKTMWQHHLLAAAASMLAQRPVRLALSREGVFRLVGGRAPTEQRVALGATAEGRLEALIHTGTTVLGRHNAFPEAFILPSRQAYRSDTALLEVQAVRMDMLANTFMRAPGEAVGTFGLECAMDELAERLGMDPIALRIANEPERDPTEGTRFSSRNLVDAMRLGADRFGWGRRPVTPRSLRDGEWRVGMGYATATYPYHRMPGAAARLCLTAEGRATVSVAAHEMGMGTATVHAQIAADRLGLSIEDVTVAYGDSALPGTVLAGGSQQTAAIGAAVMAAHRKLVAQLLRLAGNDSPLAGLGPDQVRSHDSGLCRIDDAERYESYAALLHRRNLAEIVAEAAAPQPLEVVHWSMHSHGAMFCEARVSAVTGEIRIARFLGAFDCGRIINPRTAASQLRGGIIMGLGLALMEETLFDERRGRIANPSLAEYHVPVHLDVPPIEVVWTDIPDPHAPMGARGIGELGITGVGAAVANAVYNATGRRVRDLPITLDKLL